MNRFALIFPLFLLSVGCRPQDCKNNDQDCDGYADSVDCNDADSEINPDAADNVCGDHIDSNCDGVDGYLENLATYYRDTDNDGYGNPDYLFNTYCGLPDSYVTNSSDCNDFSPWINPGATETCDGLDNNCDGEIDENCPVDTGDNYDE
ncbi:MAG: Regulator of chromosome condensation [Candidatus Uhrbacteria bacterium GW2011_GWE2_45_35]|uniref:Regulator of chromosome condensation n=2 Tax=Candidatus Uhriibacteriota TaxID=1752732 RepID=A0A0G1MHW3_9BACT|nr:MAG: Regulator of chromosome condensation [Candidatus Uhrbacteria bacterium GW2011_GWF2_44_350]KKU08791.1 MAG: Regulator of chromosome condensation [Candidatus Uhrbacteria bacterium GW2011_GWE2_45_35]HBR80678.1 hypothetical protein [Candidatus Uhrbacteria bacterium]HCU31171.1 hypothetical protein [Candidatus Uhrbacteria bacterium]